MFGDVLQFTSLSPLQLSTGFEQLMTLKLTTISLFATDETNGFLVWCGKREKKSSQNTKETF